MSEVFITSDVPSGVINILTGYSKELIPIISSHMDINAIVYVRNDKKEIQLIKTNASLNVKRVFIHKNINWMEEKAQSPYLIADIQEVKTTWHPIEKIQPKSKGY